MGRCQTASPSTGDIYEWEEQCCACRTRLNLAKSVIVKVFLKFFLVAFLHGAEVIYVLILLFRRRSCTFKRLRQIKPTTNNAANATAEAWVFPVLLMR